MAAQSTSLPPLPPRLTEETLRTSFLTTRHAHTIVLPGLTAYSRDVFSQMPKRHKTDDLRAVYEKPCPVLQDEDLDDGSAWAMLVAVLERTAEVVRVLLREDREQQAQQRRREEDKRERDGRQVSRGGESLEREIMFEKRNQGDVREEVSPTPVARGRGRRPVGTGSASREVDDSAATATAREASDRRAAEGRGRREGRSRAGAGRDAETGDGDRAGYSAYRQQGTARGQDGLLGLWPSERQRRYHGHQGEEGRAAGRARGSPGFGEAREDDRQYDGDGLDRGMVDRWG
ncbi:hypothetical protein CONLIGDRAFT_686912 [Coniochaeta ligniaria NRRL 30616]|uniref:Uncharacterized protein n=1 Tax=Coniochaeta ligniaria NRRL 30616 TaxID=1408157 RepID=A0A1J7I6T8_9PEZI|nr:hypothetical protein CONLIGDRAFT_686912 [Coniochaeta ligniaria NRRL 30616]